MGKGSSKYSTLHHLQRRQLIGDAKNVDESKQGNNSWKINKRSTYVHYHDQDSLNASDKKDPAKTDDEESRYQKPVADESLLTEGDVEDDPLYETVDPEEISTSAERTTPEYVNYTAGSQNEGRFQDLERQTNTSTDGAEYRSSTIYVNLKYQREQGHIPKSKKSGRPECEAALAALRRHYRELKRRVCIQSVCDHFIQHGILLEFDLENIMRGSYPRNARVDILLQIMLRKKSQKDFKAFNGALRKTGCEDLADKLENTDGVVPDKPYMRQWSSQEVLNTWPGIEKFLMDELQPEYILDFFMQENIFSVDEYEAVFWSLGRRVEMTKTLLEIMKKHLPEALFALLYALEEVNKDMVEELEKLFDEGKEGQDAPENCCKKLSNTDVHLVAVHEASFSVPVPLSPTPVSTIRLTVEKEGIVMENVEIEINKYVNNTDSACLLQVFLPPTGCDIVKSERGCVTIELRPHSKYALSKLFMFCQSGGLKDFVLNLLRETDIFSSLPEGELCINIQVQYQMRQSEAEDAEEINTDLIKSIKDNWSFLCEELDVKALISCSLKKAVLTDEETAELEGRTATNRHEDADYFLKSLLKKGPAGIQFLMDALKEKKNVKIINRLQKSDPLYRNPKVVKENLIVHFESIVQEIDPSQFKDTFVDRNILDGKFFTDLREKHLRRRCRAALFLKEVLNKGNRALYALVDVMTEMGYEELVAKLVSVEDNLLKSKQQEKDDRKEDTVMKVSNVSSREGFAWSCCMKVNVEKKGKDETKQQTSGSSSMKDEPIYMNVLWNDVDECIGEAEEESPVTMRSEEGMGQMNRPVTHSESSLSHYLDSDSDKCMTYPRTRESEEAKKGIRSLIISETTWVKGDSGIDISISKPAKDDSIVINEQSAENIELEDIRALDVMLATLSDQASSQILRAKTKSLIKKYRDFAREADWLKCLEDTLQKNLTESELRQIIFVILLPAHRSDLEDFLKTCSNRNDILQIYIRYVLNVGDVQAKAIILNIAARELQANVGKKDICVWEGENYRDEKGGELSLVCFYASDLQGQPKVFLGLPVLYKEWNTIENEPIENFLTEEYLNTSFTQEETEIKNILLDHYTKDLFEKHSNLEAVSASSVKSSKTRGIIKTPSIVLYCRFKGVIPVGEDHFPKELRIRNIALPTDVREGFFTLGMMKMPAPMNFLKPTEYQPVLKMGSSIGREGVQLAGTLGPFVSDNQGNTGFLTCAHVVGIDKQSTIKNNVVQPADSDSTFVLRGRNRVCGQIKNVCFDDQRQIGIDAAFVIVDRSKRDIDSINFAWNDSTQLHVAGFDHEKQPPSFLGGDVKSKINFDDVEGRRVIKCGRSTGLKKGSIALAGLSVRIHNSSLTFPTGMPWMSNVNVVMKGQYLVESSASPFFDLGDSGAGVYLVEHKQNKLSLIGLAIGLLNANYCVVTPIENVLEALGLEPENVLSSEMMDVDLETQASSSSSFGTSNGWVVHGNDR